jgi:hypothetical protein
MNGKHDNFKFTQVRENDPTANAEGSYINEKGARLWDKDRFCLWCQETVTARILEKTGRRDEPGALSDPNEWGQWADDRWVTTWHQRCWSFFDVDAQIATNEANYADMNPGRNGEPLWQSDLYRPFAAGLANPPRIDLPSPR